MIDQTLAEECTTEELYINLMMRILINHIYQDRTRSWIKDDMNSIYSADERLNGEDHPHTAHTMIGWKRLENIRKCFEQIVADEIPGDLIETGVWRGGAVIFMRALIKASKQSERSVWVADSFDGVPPPNSDSSSDAWSKLHELSHLRVSIDEVKDNFKRYGLLDEQVKFLPGLFQATLKKAPIEKLAIMRLDGDLYDSTISALDALYHKLSPGGFVIVDDYYTFDACSKATNEFRIRHNISDEILRIDRNAVYWRKLN